VEASFDLIRSGFRIVTVACRRSALWGFSIVFS
jgi:hypothetical protein